MSLLKRATGGDPIITRSHHEQSYEFLPQFTMWVICNDRPRVPDNDTGMWRRIRELPFRTVFPKPDTTIRPALSNPAIAGPAILSWATMGCLEWQTHGMGEAPAAVLEATTEYRLDMDPLLEWREEHTQSEPHRWTAFKALFADYQDWAKDNGIRRPLGRKTFAQRFAQHYEPRKASAGIRGFIGVILSGNGQSGISEMHLTYNVPVDSYENISHGEEPTTQRSQMPLPDITQAQPRNATLDVAFETPHATEMPLDPWDEDET